MTQILNSNSTVVENVKANVKDAVNALMKVNVDEIEDEMIIDDPQFYIESEKYDFDYVDGVDYGDIELDNDGDDVEIIFSSNYEGLEYESVWLSKDKWNREELTSALTELNDKVVNALVKDKYDNEGMIDLMVKKIENEVEHDRKYAEGYYTVDLSDNGGVDDFSSLAYNELERLEELTGYDLDIRDDTLYITTKETELKENNNNKKNNDMKANVKNAVNALIYVDVDEIEDEMIIDDFVFNVESDKYDFNYVNGATCGSITLYEEDEDGDIEISYKADFEGVEFESVWLSKDKWDREELTSALTELNDKVVKALIKDGYDNEAMITKMVGKIKNEVEEERKYAEGYYTVDLSDDDCVEDWGELADSELDRLEALTGYDLSTGYDAFGNYTLFIREK